MLAVKYLTVLLVVLGIISLNGCRTVAPFKREPLPLLPKLAPAVMLHEFTLRQPEVFSVMSGIVFNWRGRKLSTLCVAAVNRKTRQISVVGMNLMGIKLFAATGNEQHAKMLFAAMKLKLDQPDKFAAGIIKDIARIYLDNIPHSYEIERQVHAIKFYSTTPDKGVTQYVFGGNQPVLLEKQLTKADAVEWRVRYFKYSQVGAYNYPQAIVYDNLKYNYRLIIRVKEFIVHKAKQ